MPATKRREDCDNIVEDNGGLMVEAEPIVLTARDWEAFLAAWDDVDRPRPQLEALVQRYRDCHLLDVG